MLVALDIGNTSVSWGVFEGADLVGCGRCETDAEIRESLSGTRNIGSIIAATVAPERAEMILGVMQPEAGVAALVAGRDFAVPVRNLTTAPEETGIDRLLAACAAYRKTGAATIVIDAGSAVTIDYVDAAGGFHGGVILPGAAMNIRALHRYAEQLPRVRLRKPRRLIGRNTEEAMCAGCHYGLLGAVSGIIGRMKRETAADAVIVTGGAGETVAEELGPEASYHPFLVLEGLRLAYEARAAGGGDR